MGEHSSDPVVSGKIGDVDGKGKLGRGKELAPPTL